MFRIAASILLAVVSFAAVPGSIAWAQSYGKAERRDPIFLRFSEMANRYWVNSETNSASHKVVAIPMPKQCAFLYADAYTRGQQSEREVQDIAVSNCNRRLTELGPLGENYGVDCRCQVVISDEQYMVPKSSMPDDAYGPTSIFYRDDRGNVARLNGLVRYGALIGRDRSVTFTVENPRGEQVCTGTMTNENPGSGQFSLSCFGGKFAGRGSYESRTGAPNDHIIARGQTGRGQPVTMVIGLPAQLAANTYGNL